MFCRNCGKEVVGEASFCPYCGVKIVDAIGDIVQQQANALAQELGQGPRVATAEQQSFVKLVPNSTMEVNLTPLQVQELNASCRSDEECHSWIDNLDSDATPAQRTVKLILKNLINFTVQAGKLVLKMGKIILENVIKIVKAFKNTIAGLVAGFVLGTIFSAIPLIGWLLGPIMIPLLTVVGGVAGFMADMSGKMHDAELEAKIRSRSLEDFSNLFKFK